MRDYVFFLVNGEPQQACGRAALGMLAPWLRRAANLIGTKIACAEGACGSCSVLLGRPHGDGFTYAPINACLYPVFSCDGCHIITVEGLNGPGHARGPDTEVLSPVQAAIVDCHGTQCGFCTPGVVISLTAFYDNPHHLQRASEARNAIEAALDGNLCRCTGYVQIIEAASRVAADQVRPLAQLYPPQPLHDAMKNATASDVEVVAVADALESEQRVFIPRSFEAALQWKAAHPQAVVVAGGTEVGVAMNVKGFAPSAFLSLARSEGLDEVAMQDNVLTLGARATWAQVAASLQEITEASASGSAAIAEFAALLRRFASPQLRNVGTVAGNIVRASPISDSLPLLLVCEAQLEAASVGGTRHIAIADFLGSDTLRPDELLRRVLVPLPSGAATLRLFKVSKRRAYDRSVVSAAFVLTQQNGHITEARVAFGGVADSARRLPQTEAYLRGQPLEPNTWLAAGQIAQGEIAPLSDGSASQEYRRQLVANLFRKFGSELAANP